MPIKKLNNYSVKNQEQTLKHYKKSQNPPSYTHKRTSQQLKLDEI
jgi:hypothetical protein